MLSRMVILPCNVCIQRSRVKFTDLALGFAPLEYRIAGLKFISYRIAVFQWDCNKCFMQKAMRDSLSKSAGMRDFLLLCG